MRGKKTGMKNNTEEQITKDARNKRDREVERKKKDEISQSKTRQKIRT